MLGSSFSHVRLIASDKTLFRLVFPETFIILSDTFLLFGLFFRKHHLVFLLLPDTAQFEPKYSKIVCHLRHTSVALNRQ